MERDRLPVLSPTVSCTRWLLPVPAATMQAIELSDLQPVASHDVCPDRTPAVCKSPRLEPATVKLTDPVDAQLSNWFIGKLTADSSIDQLSVTLPDAPSPAVTMRRPLPAADDLPALHKTEVSEIQSVPSYADWPSLAWPLAIFNPNPDPRTVMLVDGVPAKFLLRIPLTAP